MIQVFPLIFNRFFLIFSVIISFNGILNTFFYMRFCSYCNQNRCTVSYEASHELFPQIFSESQHQWLILGKRLVIRRRPYGASLTASRYMHNILLSYRSFFFLRFCSSVFHCSRNTNRFPIEWVHTVELYNSFFPKSSARRANLDFFLDTSILPKLYRDCSPRVVCYTTLYMLFVQIFGEPQHQW